MICQSDKYKRIHSGRYIYVLLNIITSVITGNTLRDIDLLKMRYVKVLKHFSYLYIKFISLSPSTLALQR